jgi:DNA-binding FadR family transcriptional regulator
LVDKMMDRSENVLSRVKHFVTRQDHALNSRLPPERDLAEELGITRAALRRAFDVLEAEGLIWHHVGRGTFVGNRPVEDSSDIPHIIERTNPLEVMETRLLLGPELARVAAMRATDADVAKMRLCLRKSRAAREWRVYEVWDSNLHQATAEATHNTVIYSLYEILQTVRRAVVWARPREKKPAPETGHHMHAEHKALVEAIASRRMDEAEGGMRAHLESVRDNLLESYNGQGRRSVP